MDELNDNKDSTLLEEPLEEDYDNKGLSFSEEPLEEDIKPSTSGEASFPHANKFQHIKNKIIRNLKFQKFKKEANKAKRQERAKRKQSDAPKQIPHTLESLREKDETNVGDLNAEDNEIIREDLSVDEFSDYFQQSYEPKTLITFSDNPCSKTRLFGKELSRILPNSRFLFRNRSGIKKMVKSATEHGYTDLIVVNENRKEPNGMLMIHLPNGPTAHFKLSNLKLTPEMRKNYRDITVHRPEVALQQFTTRLGMSVGRQLAALFHYSPEFEGRRIVTFHNQRDFIFFRHYKYTFNEDGTKSKLKELGPRFTLKLRSLQKGTFDSKQGQFEWIMENRRRQVETSRRKFVL